MAPAAEGAGRSGAAARAAWALGAGLAVAGGLAAWNVFQALLAFERYRDDPGLAAELFAAALGIYALLIFAMVLPVSLIGALAGRGAPRGRGRTAAWHAAAAAGAGAALFGAGTLAARGPGRFLGSAPDVLDGLLAAGCTAACAALAARVAAAALRSAPLAAFLRLLLGILIGAPLTLLVWVLVRDALDLAGRSAAGLLAGLGALAAGTAAGIGLVEAARLVARGASLALSLRGGPRRPRAGAGALLLAAAIGAAAPILSGARPSPAPGADGPRRGRPNVVLMVADTLRADRLGCYGASRPATPHLDALAARGARVEEVYANSSWTVPSTASLLTGLHPSSHGLMTYKDRLRESAVSLAEVLARDGYVSAGIAANPVLSEKLGFGAGFDVWEEEIARGVLRRHREAPVVATLEALGLHEPEEHFPRAEEVVRRGLEWLDRRPAGPFFLYLHFMDPHDPYAPPPPYDTRYLRPGAAQMRMRFGTLPEIMQGLRPAGAVELEALLGLYDGSVAYMDDQVGRFLAALEERGLLRDTLVVFTSDHGEEFNEHGGLGHEHTLYEELVRIPLVAAGPGIVEGRVLRGPVRLIDVAPTILEAAGLTFPVPVEGASFLGALAGEQDLEPREVFMEEAYIGIRSPVHALRAIRAGDLKLIGSTFHVQGIGPWRWELYDLRADPSERRDLAGDRPAEAASLQDRLEAWARRPRAAAPGEAPLDRELEEKLRALGYIQ